MVIGLFGLSLLSPLCSEIVDVEGQPLGANLLRVVEAMEYLGFPLSADLKGSVVAAAETRDAETLQRLVDPLVLATIEINPELRVKAIRGEGSADLQQHGHTPVLLKVWNLATVSQALSIESPQAGAVYSSASLGILKRQAQTELIERENVEGRTDRFLEVSVFRSSPMTQRLSGLEVEYVIALISSSESGKREATLRFDVGQGTQDLGFRSKLPVLFEVRPAVAVPLEIREESGEPSVARLTFRDALGRVYPPQPKRVAPDFFFQPHIYRADGESVWLPPGKFRLTATRGSEYLTETREVTVREGAMDPISITLKRWIDPEGHGFYVGDHHIHGSWLFSLHLAHGGSAAGAHVSPGEGGGAQRGLRVDLGAVLRLPAPIFLAGFARPQRGQGLAKIRCGSERLRFGGAGACVLAQSIRPDLSRIRRAQ